MPTRPALGQEQLTLVDVVERLVTEYDGALPAGTVMRFVAQCREELRGLEPSETLPAAVERLARRRLQSRLAE